MVVPPPPRPMWCVAACAAGRVGGGSARVGDEASAVEHSEGDSGGQVVEGDDEGVRRAAQRGSPPGGVRGMRMGMPVDLFRNKKCHCTDPICSFPEKPSQIWGDSKQFALCNFTFAISNFVAWSDRAVSHAGP